MMKRKYYNSKDYKTRYAKINRLKIVYNRFNFEIMNFYTITKAETMCDIIYQTLERMDNYRTARNINSFIKQWLFFNKIYKLFTILNKKNPYKYRFHYKLNIFQTILLNIVSIFSIEYWKYFLNYTKYEYYYHINKGDLLKWMKKKRHKKLNSELYMM